jgi:hypothetical protein
MRNYFSMLGLLLKHHVKSFNPEISYKYFDWNTAAVLCLYLLFLL